MAAVVVMTHLDSDRIVVVESLHKLLSAAFPVTKWVLSLVVAPADTSNRFVVMVHFVKMIHFH